MCYLEAIFKSSLETWNPSLLSCLIFYPSATINKMRGFHYLPCPLCRLNVNESRPDDFYVLPLDRSLATLLARTNWHWATNTQLIFNGDFRSSKFETYPSVSYWKRLFLFHRRCFDFVKNLSPLQIHLLVDVVEPTFLDRSLPPVSKYGAFSLHSSYLHSPALHLPRWTEPRLFKRLPPEVQDMVFEHDIGRLLFVIRAASQIATWHKDLKTMPERRFTQEILFLKDNIRIYPINIGGQIYISHLSNITNKGQSRTGQDYNLNRSDYLAIKSDGTGVIDIAFSATDAGPKWILGSYGGRQFPAEISIIRCADVHRLRIIRDVATPPI